MRLHRRERARETLGRVVVDPILVSGFLVAVAVLLIGLGLGTLLKPLARLPTPLRFLLGIGSMQLGTVLLLTLVAAMASDQSVWGLPNTTSGGWVTGLTGDDLSVAAQLRGLGMAVIVLGFLWQVLLIAALMALVRSGQDLQPEVLAEAADAQWRLAQNEPPAAESDAARSSSGRKQTIRNALRLGSRH